MTKTKWLLAALLGSLLGAAGPLSAQTADGVLILLIRHAETTEDARGEELLSEEGTRRAQRLVKVLADVPLTAVHTTPYRRTRETAAPIAAARGLTAKEYDATQLDAF